MSEQKAKPGREALYEAMAEYVKAQRSASRKGNYKWMFFGATMLAYMGFNVWYMMQSGQIQPVAKNYAAVVRVDGQIATGKLASTSVLYPVLEKAFGDKKALCVALLINSPGGMVGQSQMLHDYIAKLAKKNDKKVIAVGEDMMASGGYLIATAASRIYAPTMAAVGSIGVRQDGYDLTGIAEKLGIKDRTLTAGRMKDSMNPLKPLSAEAETKARHDLEQIHTVFKQYVKESRGDRIKVADDDVFTGEVFTGMDGVKLGLLDGNLDIEDAVKTECNADGVKVYEGSLGLDSLLGFLNNR